MGFFFQTERASRDIETIREIRAINRDRAELRDAVRELERRIKRANEIIFESGICEPTATKLISCLKGE